VTAQTAVGTPTAVTLVSFSAKPSALGVLLRWRTGAEAKLLGFHVYRQSAGKRLRLNRALIPARSSVAGAAYRYLDRHVPRRVMRLRYSLEAIGRDGSRRPFGPVNVRTRKERR
jgi:hypothetical protein